MSQPNRYERIIERIFLDRYERGAEEVPFDRDDIRRVAKELEIELPRNLGDIVYAFRYRSPLPAKVRSCAPEGMSWVILPAGHGRYKFALRAIAEVLPNRALAETKIPDSTPGVIEMYAFSDEQALLAKLRYNRLIDIFTGVACYSLQNHLRTTVPGMGQVETDEVYVGVDRKRAHYIFPVQAKGGNNRLSVVQIEQDFALCEAKFGNLLCRPVAARFMADNLIALFEFERTGEGIAVTREKHYRLVASEDLTTEDILSYRARLPDQ